MKDFIKIKTLFDSSEQRIIEYLSKKYDNYKCLENVVRKLILPELLINETIENKKILIKPNWVLHSSVPTDEICLRTHDNVLLALIHVLLEHKPSSIMIGDAPVNVCNWEKMLSEYFVKEVTLLSKRSNIPIQIKDFRRFTLNEKSAVNKDRYSLSEYVIFDTGKNSYLEPISIKNNSFRVTNYDPDRLSESHRKGVHKYCITKELFEADIVISVPKLKTHQKTGVTGALKNLVGVNGDKDYLPHHRIGGIGHGGDCYPGNNYLRLLAEKILDTANRNIGSLKYHFLKKTVSLIWRLSFPKAVHHIAAAWHGNDTCWRMVMDLNMIAIYGKKDGSLSNSPQRVLYSLCDGIIGGQGDGPLHPQPLPLGILTFSNNSSITDICAATLMGFDINKIFLLQNAQTAIKEKEIDIFLNEKKIDIENLKSLAIETIPAPGWIEYLKNK
jgi:uncharacterized protein (DUF362 family)